MWHIGDDLVVGFDKEWVKLIKENNLQHYLMNCYFGLEKENARVDKTGKLAFTPHPKVFGDRLKNPYIKTDFSESQIELVTSVCNTIEETYNFLESLHDMVSLELKEEYLWPQSTPPYLPEGEVIPIAKMGDRAEEVFREVLAEKYGRKKQLISGIHYNFSFKEEFIKTLYDKLSKGESYIEFKNNIYLRICRNFMKYRWLPIYLTGASPVFHSSFIEQYVEESHRFDEESCFFPNMISLRNSDYGYKNRENFYVPFDSVEQYIHGINRLVEQGELQDICEFYCPMRLKTGNNDNLVNELLEDGIKYIEIRILDLNPLFKSGISKDILYFIHIFTLYLLFKEDEKFNEEEHQIANKNAELSASFGIQEELYLYSESDNRIPFKEEAMNILSKIEEMLKAFELNNEYFGELINIFKGMVLSPKNTFAGRIIKGTKEKSFVKFHLDKAREYLEESKNNEVNLKNKELSNIIEFK